MIALITGANKGIGYQTARLLIERDVTVVSGFRTAEQGAAIAVRLALLDEDGPTGAYLSDEGPVPW